MALNVVPKSLGVIMQDDVPTLGFMCSVDDECQVKECARTIPIADIPHAGLKACAQQMMQYASIIKQMVEDQLNG